MKIFRKIISLILTAAVMMSMISAATVSVGAYSMNDRDKKLNVLAPYLIYDYKLGSKTNIYVSGISQEEMDWILNETSQNNGTFVCNLSFSDEVFVEYIWGTGISVYSFCETAKKGALHDVYFYEFGSDYALVFELNESIAGTEKAIDTMKESSACDITFGIKYNDGFKNFNNIPEDSRVIFMGSEKDNNKNIANESTSTSISSLSISKISNKSYTGKAIKPAVTIKDGDKKLVKGTDYTVSYKNNTKIGTASVTIKGKGSYTGEKTLTFKIVPAKTTLKVSKKSDKKAVFSWNAVKGAEKYQLYYSVDGGKTYKKYTTISGSKTSYTASKLDFKKYDYKFKIRAYDKVGKTTYYGSYSKIVSVK